MIRAVQTLRRSPRTEGSLREVVGQWERSGLWRNRLGSNITSSSLSFPLQKQGNVPEFTEFLRG